jgi:hypothetical protein
LRVVNFDSAIAVNLEEDLDMVIEADIEAQRNVNKIGIARITNSPRRSVDPS